MLVKVELLGDLGKSTENGDRKVEVEVDTGMTVGEVLESLGVTRDQTWNAAMNGNLAYETDVVAEGATLIVFPPIQGG
ncbi:MAG: MoaD/ThiS family protein [SAR202 cluster bacterium]|jgi:sulfur carrier protein ThiS|nr:MoaD/ThiS family protein [SAR202 cluster bacterium]MDP6301133.1 MoaD/ThiS family protein [SAR202 cluster bacterium]MDP7103466.1 MoaD/ThiS family protein [SAR202 cluster bacterium]MDP7226373.1 MoaD/ThiS family protein [SAR202 cluster bacterium]MDP7415177.1 MoaD/ThiS family protein [SAR202 cluster bacterium]|tara:strand:- start:4288 stop:4521 length:234 start_codon:yes stop_codon:yes gene_type:complete